MNRRGFARAISLVLVLAVLCSLIVLPVSAETVTTPIDSKWTFTAWNDDALPNHIAKGTEIKAKLVSSEQQKFTGFELTVALDATKLSFGATESVEDYDDNGDPVLTDLYGSTETKANITPFTKKTNGTHEVVKIIGVTERGAINPWDVGKAIGYFKLIVTADDGIDVKDLPAAFEVLGKNDHIGNTLYGVEECRSFVSKVEKSGDTTYLTSNYNVCPYVETIGHTLGNEAYDTKTTVADLRNALSFTAYEASGEHASYKKETGVKIYAHSYDTQELDDTEKLSKYLTGTEGDKSTGSLYIEVTTSTGLTFGQTIEIKLKKDTIKSISVTPKDASKGYTFVYTYQGPTMTNGFTLADGCYTVTATYMSGETGEIGASKLHYGAVNAGAEEINAEYEGFGAVRIDLGKAIPKVVASLPTAVTTSYTGSEQTVSWADDTFKQDYYTVTAGDKQTNAGDHDVTLTLNDKDNVKWPGSEETTKTVTWKIKRAKDYAEITQGTDQKIYTSTPVSTIVAGLALSRPDGSTVPLPTNYTIAIFRADGSTPYGDTNTLTESDTYWVTLKPTGNDAKNYENVSSFVRLTVQERKIQSIAIKAGSEPSKKTYEYGDKFDPTGLTVVVTYDNAETEDIAATKDNFTWSALDTVSDNVTVTGTMKSDTTKTVTVSGIKVARKSITAQIEMVNPNEKFVYDGQEKKPPVKVTYMLTAGNPLDLPAGEYKVEYRNNVNASTESTPAVVTVTSENTSNYNITTPATKLFYIDPKPVTISGVQSGNKVFDGTTAASVTGSFQIVGKVGNDDVSVKAGSANFNSAFVKEATTVSFKGFGLQGPAAKNYTLEKQPDPVSAKINQVTLTLSAPTVTKTKAYDGTADAQITHYGTLSGFVKDGDMTYPAYLDEASCKATFDSAEVGTGKTITFTGFTLKGDYAANYTVDQPTAQSDGAITAANVNDRNTGKEITQLKNGAAFTEPDISGVDNETITGGTFSFKYSDSDAETFTSEQLATSLKGKTVGDYTVTFTYTHTNPNYVSPVTGTMTAHVRDIEFKVGEDPATMLNTYPWDNTYGGLIYAGKESTWATYLKKLADPVAEVNGQTIEGTYAIKVYDANGNEVEKGFTPGNYVFKLIFNDTNGQYSNTEVWATSAASIGKAWIVVADGSASGITVKNRAYNGSDDVTASDLDMSGLVLKYVTGPLTGQTVTDTVTLAYASAKYDSKNAGNRTVTLRTLSLDGADKDNFTLANASPSSSYKSTIELPAEITKRNVTITGTTAGEKVYDGGTSATITNDGILSWKYSTDKVEIVRGSATYDNKNVGTGKTVTFSGFELTGEDAGNYNLTQQPADTTANITARDLKITNFTVKDKVYDGNDIAEIVSIETDAVEGDDVKCSNAIARFVASGTFSASDAQNGKKVTLKFPQGVILAGADKDNYTFDSADLPDEVTATIHKATLTGQPTFTKITQSGKTLLDIKDSDVDLTAIHGVSGEPNPLYPVLIWGEDRNTVIQPNKSYSWEVKVAGASADNYLPLTGSVVLYPVSTGYSEQVKKQIEEFEAKKRGELPEEDTTFRDVSEDDYFFDAVNWAAENGITGGVSANRFGPTQDCSRGQTMTFLWRAMGEPEPASRASDLTDVMTGSYYYDAVLWAMEAGITTGAGANRFAPDATVTRGQFVTFLYRLANASSSGEHPFTDVPAGSYYEKAIAWAYAEGITKGTGATTFSPDAPCTRAQIITFLYRYFNR